jgi:low affinity Fe/Cu permease
MDQLFTRIATKSANVMGRPSAFLIATSACVLWAVTGPIFHYSDTWQLVINTGTTVLTFLAVFLIQNSQNRDGSAIQAKLELMRALPGARPAFIGIEHLTDDEICAIRSALENEAGSGSPTAVSTDATVDELLSRR